MDQYEDSLCDLIERSSNPPKYLKSLTDQMLSALMYLKNIIHRDVKPANLLYDANRTLHLSDFGVSKQQNNTFTPIWTAVYAAPEVLCARDQTPKAEVFPLGSVMLEFPGLLSEYKIDDLSEEGNRETGEWDRRQGNGKSAKV